MGQGLMAESTASLAFSTTDGGSVMSGETVDMEQKDVVGEVTADEENDKRIEMVGDILNTDLSTIVKRSKGVVMSTGF